MSDIQAKIIEVARRIALRAELKTQRKHADVHEAVRLLQQETNHISHALMSLGEAVEMLAHPLISVGTEQIGRERSFYERELTDIAELIGMPAHFVTDGVISQGGLSNQVRVRLSAAEGAIKDAMQAMEFGDPIASESLAGLVAAAVAAERERIATSVGDLIASDEMEHEAKEEIVRHIRSGA